MIIAAAIGATAHRDDIFRVRHLSVHAAQRGCHLVAQRPRDDHHVRLAWARARRGAEAFHVVTRNVDVDHLDRAAREAKGHPPPRTRARPVEQIRTEEHTSELPYQMRISYAAICLKTKNQTKSIHIT